MKKKNYNPFKMWESWIGGILLSLIGAYMNYKDCTGSGLICSRDFRVLYLSPQTLIYLIIGFLLGWAIESLWRKFK